MRHWLIDWLIDSAVGAVATAEDLHSAKLTGRRQRAAAGQRSGPGTRLASWRHRGWNNKGQSLPAERRCPLQAGGAESRRGMKRGWCRGAGQVFRSLLISTNNPHRPWWKGRGEECPPHLRPSRLPFMHRVSSLTAPFPTTVLIISPAEIPSSTGVLRCQTCKTHRTPAAWTSDAFISLII